MPVPIAAFILCLGNNGSVGIVEVSGFVTSKLIIYTSYFKYSAL